MKHALHKLIVWYLRRCGGAFHCYPYGERGRYAVLMTERQYHRYTQIAEQSEPGERFIETVRADQAAKG
jgi:hypothetical protein